MSLVVTLLSGLLVGAAPFALISDVADAALIAGIFSAINTMLNGYLIRQAKRNNDVAITAVEHAEVAAIKADNAQKILERRKSDIPHAPERRTEDDT